MPDLRPPAGAPALAHVTLSVATAAELDSSARCYDAALGALGMVRLAELVDEEEDDAEVEAIGWGPDGGGVLLWLITGHPVSAGVHLRFEAYSRLDVETFWRAGIDAGAVSRAVPRRWTPYRRGEFSAMLVDPAGNVLEAVAAE